MINLLTQFYKLIGVKTAADAGVAAKKKKDGEPFFMYLSVVIAYLTAFTSGLSVSWTSPVIPKFKTEENPFNATVTTTQVAMLTSFLPLGAVSGPLIAGYIADRYGRKFTMLLLTFPSMTGFCLLAFAKIIELWYLARFLLGIGVGCFFALCPMYVAEISQNHNRAKFGCLFGVFITLGLFYPFSVGAHLIIPLYAMTCNIPLVVFLIGGFRELLTSQPAKRAMFICIGLVLLQELSGIHPMMAYLKPIFQASGTKISPDISTVIFGISQISSNFITALIVEKIGRRILYMVSAVGCAIACAIMTVYFFLLTRGADLESVFWLPLTCLVIYMIFFSCGLGPLAWSIVGEIFPSNIKGIGSGLTVCISFSASFLVLLMFPIVSEAVGMSAPFGMYTVVTIIGLFFIYYKVPETRGMTLAEIQETLRKTDKKSKEKGEMPQQVDSVTTHF